MKTETTTRVEMPECFELPEWIEMPVRRPVCMDTPCRLYWTLAACVALLSLVSIVAH